MNKVVAFTVVYPSSEKYFSDFIECLQSQSYKNFDLLIVNDGCKREDLRPFCDFFNAIIEKGVLSPVKNREIGIKKAFECGYEKLIFCDIDDWFSFDRFFLSIEKLKSYDIVVNNLNIVDSKHSILCPDYFSFSITDNTIIDKNFLEDKNLLGLSNSAIRLTNQAIVDMPEDLSIADWFYFTVCAERDLTIGYIKDSLTDYRQHSNNLIGIDDFSIDLFKKMMGLKIKHYAHLSNLFPKYVSYYKSSLKLQSLSDEMISSVIKKNKSINSHPLWWENIKI